MARSDNELRKVVNEVFQRHRNVDPPQSALIPMLQDVQSELGYLSKAVLEQVSQLLKLPASHVYGVATFYHQFRLRPKGRHLITVCRGTACHVQGSQGINEFLKSELIMNSQDDTSDDGIFTLQQVRCVGACGLAPVIKIDESFYGKMDPSKTRRVLTKYRAMDKGSAT